MRTKVAFARRPTACCMVGLAVEKGAARHATSLARALVGRADATQLDQSKISQFGLEITSDKVERS
jgi:hypothetical protein